MESIILASASPRRKELLLQAKIPFTVYPSGVDEAIEEFGGNPSEKAEELARLKALDVAKVISNGLILGADTIVVLNNVIYGKPRDDEDAFRMLTSLSGCEHSVITGLALVDSCNGKIIVNHEITKVKFARLSSKTIKNYIESGEPFGKAGAYAVQGLGALLVERIEGCYFNIVGLPLMRFSRMLEEYGIYTVLGKE